MIFDSFASRIAVRYEMFLLAIAGRYQQSASAGVKVSPQSLRSLRNDLTIMMKSYLVQVRDDAEFYLDSVNHLSISESKNAVDGYIKQVALLVSSNITTLTAKAVGADRLGSTLKGEGGAMGMLLQKRAAVVSFSGRDSSGRNWKANALMKLQAREFAYRLAIRNQAAGIGRTNDLAKIVYPDPTHKNNGMIVSLSGNDAEHLSLQSVMSEIFHPNSTATLTYV